MVSIVTNDLAGLYSQLHNILVKWNDLIYTLQEGKLEFVGADVYQVFLKKNLCKNVCSYIYVSVYVFMNSITTEFVFIV